MDTLKLPSVKHLFSTHRRTDGKSNVYMLSKQNHLLALTESYIKKFRLPIMEWWFLIIYQVSPEYFYIPTSSMKKKFHVNINVVPRSTESIVLFDWIQSRKKLKFCYFGKSFYMAYKYVMPNGHIAIIFLNCVHLYIDPDNSWLHNMQGHLKSILVQNIDK